MSWTIPITQPRQNQSRLRSGDEYGGSWLQVTGMSQCLPCYQTKLTRTFRSLAARFKGPVEGVYQVHPRHMIVRKPLNVNDEDLYDGVDFVERPMSQPTEMSYLLQRLRLAELSRTIVDRNPLMMARSSGLSYHDVMDFDTDLQTFINDIPAFFSMNLASLVQSFQINPTKAKFIM